MHVYLLDTNIISLLDRRRQGGVPELVGWLSRNGVHLFLSAITFLELEAGILKLRREDKAKRADELTTFMEGVLSDFGERVLIVDAAIALKAARTAEAVRPMTLGLSDLLIAATAQTHALTVLTRNLRHFQPTGVAAIDPLAALPPDVAR